MLQHMAASRLAMKLCRNSVTGSMMNEHTVDALLAMADPTRKCATFNRSQMSQLVQAMFNVSGEPSPEGSRISVLTDGLLVRLGYHSNAVDVSVERVREYLYENGPCVNFNTEEGLQQRYTQVFGNTLTRKTTMFQSMTPGNRAQAT